MAQRRDFMRNVPLGGVKTHFPMRVNVGRWSK